MTVTLTDNALFRQQCYINGRWCDADDGATFTVTILSASHFRNATTDLSLRNDQFGSTIIVRFRLTERTLNSI